MPKVRGPRSLEWYGLSVHRSQASTRLASSDSGSRGRQGRGNPNTRKQCRITAAISALEAIGFFLLWPLIELHKPPQDSGEDIRRLRIFPQA